MCLTISILHNQDAISLIKKFVSPDWFYQYFECMINYLLQYLVFAMLLTARAPSSCLVKGAIFLENCTLAYWHFAVFDQR
jgi:hypothetical protein